jgi:hypothetical protein
MNHPIHTLWCHPRSVSTAFERVMRERGDLHAFHEPFMYHYYLSKIGRPYAGFTPDPDHPKTYADIRAMLLTQAEKTPVFQKDMAYYVLPEILKDDALLTQATHAFLVRDPAESIASYARIDPDFTSHEIGIRSQWEMLTALRAKGLKTHVIIADGLRADPAKTMAAYWDFAGLAQKPDALNWDKELPKGWETVAVWHQQVLSSGTIQNQKKPRAPLTPAQQKIYQDHKPYYDKLVAEAAS